MSTNHTPIYDFCLWQPEDRVLRVDFNENNLKIESELAGTIQIGRASCRERV